jgi:hypothetical protein
MTGTEASVTYQARIDLDVVRLWFRWKNPHAFEVTSRKEAKFQTPSRFQVALTEDTEDSTIYRINYEIRFDPKFEPSIAAPNSAKMASSSGISGSNGNRRRSFDETMEEDWIALDHDNEGPTMKPKEVGKMGQVIHTAYGDTKYYSEDWISVLKSARRSVLVTITNDTKYICKRSEWSLKFGLWRAIPSEKIGANAMVQFGTASHVPLGGTMGSVTYIIAIPNAGDYIVTFSWTNQGIRGIHNTATVTTNIPESRPEHGSLHIFTESNDERACDVTFRITDSTNASPSPSSATETTKGISSEIGAKPTTVVSAPIAPRRTAARIQEDGVTINHTALFTKTRAQTTTEKKVASTRLETDLEIVAHHLIQLARKKQNEGSFFDSIFSRDPTLEEEADKVVPTKTPMPTSTPACPITNQKFTSPDDKKYCYLCGRLVFKGVIVIIPFPSSCALDLSELKKPPQGIQGCLNCNESIQNAERLIQWREQLATASKLPVHAIMESVIRTRLTIKSSLQDLKRMIASNDKDTPLVVSKIKALVGEIDDLELRLFALNEESSRAQQKVNNKVAENVRNWKEQILPELEALEEASKNSR